MLDDALDARAREHGRLDADLEVEALVRAAADARVLALGVLAHEEHVDVAGPRPASAHGTPSSSRTGRTFAHRSSRWRIGRSSPQSVTWSGTSGRPTAPSRIASKPRGGLERIRRHHRAVRVEVVGAPREVVPLDLEPERVDDRAPRRRPRGRRRHRRSLRCDASTAGSFRARPGWESPSARRARGKRATRRCSPRAARRAARRRARGRRAARRGRRRPRRAC